MRIFEWCEEEGFVLVECVQCGRAHRLYQEENLAWPQFVAAVDAMPERTWPGCCEERKED